jgi:hypothetical protein
MSITELIALLEAAIEGSDGLDRAIRDTLVLPAMLVPPDGGDEAYPYTLSLDSALTLVPDGMVWTVLTDFGGLCRARVYSGDGLWQADGATPALAACIAALKAIAARGKAGGVGP